MRRVVTKLNFLMIAFLMFSIGVRVDSYLRNQNGTTDCYCVSYKCRVVSVTDNPMIVLKHPIEVFKFLTYQD